jgi:hypothetical protein
MQKGIEEAGDMGDTSFDFKLIVIWEWSHFLKVNLVMIKYTSLATMTDEDPYVCHGPKHKPTQA